MPHLALGALLRLPDSPLFLSHRLQPLPNLPLALLCGLPETQRLGAALDLKYTATVCLVYDLAAARLFARLSNLCWCRISFFQADLDSAGSGAEVSGPVPSAACVAEGSVAGSGAGSAAGNASEELAELPSWPDMAAGASAIDGAPDLGRSQPLCCLQGSMAEPDHSDLTSCNSAYIYG